MEELLDRGKAHCGRYNNTKRYNDTMVRRIKESKGEREEREREELKK